LPLDNKKSTMHLQTHIVDLHMRHTFTIAHGSRDQIDGFIVALSDGTHTGYGEATPIPYYGISAELMQSQIEQIRPFIKNHKLMHPAAFWEAAHTHLADSPFALCALDMAAWDLFGKKQGMPLYKYWGLDISKNVASNYTIGIDTIPKMVEKMAEFDFPIYKIKLGTDHDIDIVKALRKHTDALFRVDANCAWSPEQTLENASALKKLNVQFIEQPLAAEDLHLMPEVYKYSALPLIADESCLTEVDVALCHGAFHGINIKLAKCGGITPALRMIASARQLGLGVMCGCMTETSVGISAIGQLLPLLDYVDMDGSILIDNDPATGVYLDKGRAIYPNVNGTGASLKL
jgi:L-Ala-D/L-Glu epimerase